MKNNKLIFLRKMFDKEIQIKRYVSAVLLLILVAITFLQVIFRFILNSPFSWSEEMTLIILLWFGYFSMSIDIYTDSHAAIYFVYNKFPVSVKKVADLFRFAILGCFFYTMTIYGLQITKINIPKLQPATRLSYGFLFAPLVYGGIIMGIYCLFNFIMILYKPLDTYKKEMLKKKTIDDINIERGGSV